MERVNSLSALSDANLDLVVGGKNGKENGNGNGHSKAHGSGGTEDRYASRRLYWESRTGLVA